MSVQEQTKPVASQAPLIELIDVHKRFGDLVVLNGVNLKISEGQTIVIIGASGVGKSVLIKHIVGLLDPDKGQILFREQRIDQLPPKKIAKLRRQFGYLFQLSALFDSMTAGENVAFPVVQGRRKPKAEVDKIVANKLRLVGLDGVQNKMPSQLSGGQKKRVALARAIALDPEVILYDEPTTGLDPVRADVINELILRLKKTLNVTSIVVTHDMSTVFKVADRVLMLMGGNFIFDGTPEELKNATEPRVQRFISGQASDEDILELDGAA